MDAGLDPFGSTSFVDLLACSLCVTIVLTLFSGSEKTQAPVPTQAFVHVEETPNSGHLFAVAIGNYALVAPPNSGWPYIAIETERGDGKARRAAIHITRSGDCDSHSLANGATAVLTEIEAFGFDEHLQFKKRIKDDYGLDTTIDNTPEALSVAISRSSDYSHRIPENVRIFVEDSGRDSRISVLTSSTGGRNVASQVLDGGLRNNVPTAGTGILSAVPIKLEVDFPGISDVQGTPMACLSARADSGEQVTTTVLLPVTVIPIVWRGTKTPNIGPGATFSRSSKDVLGAPVR